MLERSEKQAARAQKTQSLAQEKLVKEMMKQNSWLAPHFVKLGQSLLAKGSPQLLPGASMPVASTVSPRPQLALTDGTTVGTLPALTNGPAGASTAGGPSLKEPVAATAVEAAADVAASLNKPLHRQYATLVGLPQVDLRNLLTYLEPSCLHSFALRGVSSTPGAKSASKSDLCRLLEYLTGLPGDTSITNAWKSLLALGDYLKELNISRGHPVLSLRFPLTGDVWLSHGVYRLTQVSEDSLQIVHSIRHRSVITTFTDLGFLAGHFEHMSVEQNWSEQRAVLIQHGLATKIILAILFAQTSQEPSSTASTSSKYITPDKRTRRGDSFSESRPV